MFAVGAVAAAAGAGAGVGIRLLLRRLRRGVTVRPGVAEVTTALITGLGATLNWGTARIGLVLLAGLMVVALGLVDIKAHRLPDALTLPAIPVAAAMVVVTEIARPGTGSLLTAVLSVLVLWAVFAGLAAASPRSLGRGDVKLMPSLGLLTGYLGVGTVLVAVLTAFALGGLVALGGLLARRLRWASAIPFGPFLLLGTWLAVAVPGLVSALVR